METTVGGRVTLVALAFAALASVASAQDVLVTRVSVAVKDSLGAPVADASVSIVHGLRDTVASGATGPDGVRLLSVPRSHGQVQLIVRKIGFLRTDRFLTVAGHESLSISLAMKRVVTRLAAVKVTEAEDAVRKSYFIDADDIANSPRPLVDASDILTKLRQDMIYSRGGGGPNPPCPSIQNVWVNGVLVYRYFSPMQLPAMGNRNNSSRPAPDINIIVSDAAKQRARPGTPSGAIGAGRLTLLEEIKPEHIAEMTYKDCFDTSMPGNFSQNALYIVLKPGLTYEVNYGSYAADATRSGKRR